MPTSTAGTASMDDWLGLQAKTWRQLATCAYVAIAALEGMGSDEAREVLKEIEDILSPDWKGPSPR